MGKDPGGWILFFVFDNFHPMKRGKKGQDMKLDFLWNIFHIFHIFLLLLGKTFGKKGGRKSFEKFLKLKSGGWRFIFIFSEREGENEKYIYFLPWRVVSGVVCSFHVGDGGVKCGHIVDAKAIKSKVSYRQKLSMDTKRNTIYSCTISHK